VVNRDSFHDKSRKVDENRNGPPRFGSRMRELITESTFNIEGSQDAELHTRCRSICPRDPSVRRRFSPRSFTSRKFIVVNISNIVGMYSPERSKLLN
jgi:hypothetical protein